MVDNLSLRKVFKKLIEKFGGENLYADFCYLKSSEISINIDKINVDIDKSSDEGIKMRVWDGEKFLEFGQSSFEKRDIEENFINLVKTAKGNVISDGMKLDIDTESVEKSFVPEVSGESVSLENLVEKMKVLRDRILNFSEDVVNARVVFFEEDEETIFVNKHKNLYQKIPLKTLVVVAFVKAEDGSMRTAYKSFVSNDYDIFGRADKKFSVFTDEIVNLRKAKKLKGGKYKVILSPKLTGLLAHESFGHGMEADTMMKDRALASEWTGKRIGSENVNIVDYPAVSGKHGEFFFDHEGNFARKTYLVKNGVINEPMADVYSKSRLDLKFSANARFESFDHKTYTRMSNTYFEAGEENVEDMISRVEDGILITSTSGGMEDPKGWGVQIQGNFGQRIKNGKLVDEFYDGFALTGFLPDIIKNISGISKEFEIDGGGKCGKGHCEWVRVSEGGPYLLIDEVILG